MGIEYKVVKGHCPSCKGERNAKIVASHKTTWSDDDAPIGGSIDYRVLQCNGCDTVYFQEYELFSEDVKYSYDFEGKTVSELIPTIKYWPSPFKRERPEWLDSIDDSVLHDLLKEVYTALDNQLNVLAAIGLRTAFDRSSEKLSIDPSLSFIKKLEELEKRKLIGEPELKALSVLTNAGSAAAHRAWKPSNQVLDTLMNIIEQFLHHQFILKKKIKKLEKGIPKRKKSARKTSK